MNTEEKLTEQQIDEVIQQLDDFLTENKNISQNHIAREISLSGAVLSGFRKKKYTGDVQGVAKALVKFFERERQHQLQPAEEIKFVKTSNANIVWQMSEFARSEKTIGVIYGPPGCGKTFAISEYMKSNKNTSTLIEATLSIEAKTLFEMFHSELRLSGFGRIHNMLMEVVKRLEGTRHLLIIDEAEYLPYRAIEHARRLVDFAKIGLVLIGTERLVRNLKGRKGEHAQLWSRVGMAEELGPLTSTEARLIIEQNLYGVNGLWEVIYSYTKKNARVLGHLIKLIKFLSKKTGKPINEDLIHAAADQLIINK